MQPLALLQARRRLRADARGVAAVEFALVAPICILLYCVGFEVTEAASVYRKLCDTTVQMASVTSQYTGMANTDVAIVENASSQIMDPDSSTTLGVVISEVSTNPSGTATVTWSQPNSNATGLATGATVTLPVGWGPPATCLASNTSACPIYILVQTTYPYTPKIAGNFIGTINMSDQIFIAPRDSSSIPCSSCS